MFFYPWMMVGEWWISGDDFHAEVCGEPSVDSEVCRLETCSITALCLSGGNSFFLPTKGCFHKNRGGPPKSSHV